ncbi:MAG: SurA N-terminal domain-containing protein [Planctomycetes bacterium]|nr:SurA N-terminal domain-containing protein [Planctomycetota bacterium]
MERLVVPIMERLRAAAGGDARMELAERETRLRREVLDRLVERELAYQEAQIMGLTADPGKLRARETELAQVMDSADARREAERDVILADLRQRVVGRQDRVRPEAVREYYQLHKHEQTRPRLTAMTPLVIYQDRVGRRDSRDYRVIAQEIATGLELGTRFEELRRLHDEFVAAAELPPGPPPLLPDDAYAGTILASAGSLRQGAVFGPLFMEGMALFAKVVEEQVEGPVPFAEVEKDIRAVLERQEAEKAYSDWLERLRRRAKIEITD